MTAKEKKPHDHNHLELVDKVNELSEALFMLKESAQAGGLPDMHIENILKWYAWTTCDLSQQHEREKDIEYVLGVSVGISLMKRVLDDKTSIDPRLIASYGSIAEKLHNPPLEELQQQSNGGKTPRE